MKQGTIGVCIVTYNEECYIRQCIESALKQKCSEAVCVYIGEDCSIDGTYEICKEIAERNKDRVILVHRESNLGLVKNTIELLKQIKADGCEYVAMLDGDDYWIDDRKLEKQISFLKSHPDYGFVHTNIHLLYDDRWYEYHKRKNVTSGYLFDDGDFPSIAAANCSVLFRTSLLDYLELEDFVSFGLKSVDYAMYHIFLKYTKFHFLDDFTAVWRRGHSSVSNKNDVQRQIEYCYNGVNSWRLMNHYFPDKFPINEESFKAFVNMEGFKVSFRMGNYEICKQCSESPYFKPQGVADRVKQISTKTRVGFSILSSMWRAKDTIVKYLNHLQYQYYIVTK